jgi:hypothetical protein
MELEKVGSVCMDWIHVSQDRDQWRTLEYTTKKLFSTNGCYTVASLHSRYLPTAINVTI